jgi:hypothetical protein
MKKEVKDPFGNTWFEQPGEGITELETVIISIQGLLGEWIEVPYAYLCKQSSTISALRRENRELKERLALAEMIDTKVHLN